MMKKVEVSKGFIEEVNKLKGDFGWAYSAMDEVYEEDDEYQILHNYLFENSLEVSNKNQSTFVKAWIGEIELVEKEEWYVVWVKGSKTIHGSARFVLFRDEDNTIGIDYRRRDTAKETPQFQLSKEKAFKLRDTGFFEIEKVGY